MNKVSKIIKLAEDGATAISKPRLNNGRGDITGRHKSVGRVGSRGRGANGTAIFERNPQIETNLYQKEHANSLEDLKSHISRQSFANLPPAANMHQSLTPAKVSKGALNSSRNYH